MLAFSYPVCFAQSTKKSSVSSNLIKGGAALIGLAAVAVPVAEKERRSTTMGLGPVLAVPVAVQVSTTMTYFAGAGLLDAKGSYWQTYKSSWLGLIGGTVIGAGAGSLLDHVDDKKIKTDRNRKILFYSAFSLVYASTVVSGFNSSKSPNAKLTMLRQDNRWAPGVEVQLDF